ncbi:hypothetical protein [Rubripirellula obstinata]|uniref:hypothetical protein n=1 Tax=Rubripirellula obstinata TaxID=406547 RepID=UPI00122CD3BD|nr:hypothetical protein [Rubripirellula obstinata]
MLIGGHSVLLHRDDYGPPSRRERWCLLKEALAIVRELVWLVENVNQQPTSFVERAVTKQAVEKLSSELACWLEQDCVFQSNFFWHLAFHNLNKAARKSRNPMLVLPSAEVSITKLSDDVRALIDKSNREVVTYAENGTDDTYELEFDSDFVVESRVSTLQQVNIVKSLTCMFDSSLELLSETDKPFRTCSQIRDRFGKSFVNYLSKLERELGIKSASEEGLIAQTIDDDESKVIATEDNYRTVQWGKYRFCEQFTPQGAKVLGVIAESMNGATRKEIRRVESDLRSVSHAFRRASEKLRRERQYHHAFHTMIVFVGKRWQIADPKNFDFSEWCSTGVVEVV